MADTKQQPTPAPDERDEYYDMVGECHALSALARAADARLSEYDGSDQSDEIQDAKLLLRIAVEKAQRVGVFIDEARIRVARLNQEARHG
jgi:hypothetical protein